MVAHQLRRAHDVTVYEAAPYAGGHTRTITVDAPDGPHRVDIGFIVFNDRNYPLFRSLLASLGVESQPSTMSFGVSDGLDFEYANDSLHGVFANRRLLTSRAFHRVIRDVVRWQRESRKLAAASDNESSQSALEWFVECGFSEDFVSHMIGPLASAIWSADPDQLGSFPASYMARFFDHHGLLRLWRRPKWFTIAGGSETYVTAITDALGDRLRLGTPVRCIRRATDHVTVTTAGGTELFDEVILATHSDQALGLLEDPSDAERDVLGAISYQPNDVVLHTDTRVLPKRRDAWASWNFHIPETPTGRVTVTYYMNKLQRLRASDQYCVTLNRTTEIDPRTIISTTRFYHPAYSFGAVRAQQRHKEVSGRNRTHYCGAYWGWGFHEDGVASALRVAESLGVTGFA